MKIFALLVCLICAGTANADEPVRLRVLSYNIHHAEGIDKKLDVPRIAKIIKSVSPDLVALQEVDQKTGRADKVDQPDELARLTGMQVRFEKNIDHDGGKYGNATFSRFPIRAYKNTHLPNIDAGEQRGVLLCEIEIPGLDKPVVFLNTHFDHRRPSEERVASAKAINELIRKRGDALAILAGDMNDTPDGPALKVLLKEWSLPSDRVFPTVPVSKPVRQIDFVVSRPAKVWKTVEVKVLDEAVASDHRAILVVLEYVEQ